MTKWLGPALVLIFCVSQAARDVTFGNVFQGIDFFAVIVIAFTLSTVIFAGAAIVRTPGEFRKLRGHARTIVAMNLTTALAWSCYFFALTQIEPSIVNTLHSGMAPLTVIALSTFGFSIARTGSVGRTEALGYGGMVLSLAGLWWVVLSGASGLPSTGAGGALAGLFLLLVSGASITLSLLYSKRLHDAGINAEVVTAVRYIALIVLAAGAVAYRGGATGIETLGAFATIAVIATTLIVLPLFALQVGIALTAPLTGNVLRSLGPVFVFALEPFDGRISYSAPTLVCILAYSASAILSTTAHGLSAREAARAAVAPRPAGH